MRNRPSFCLVFALAAIAGLSVSAAAQQSSPAPSAPVLKTQARQVLLPVTVVYKHGALVPNLTARDFTLTEDGRAQVIASLTTQSSLPFRLGLLMDTSRSVYSAIDSERTAAKKFFDLMLPAEPPSGAPGDRSSSPAPASGPSANQAFLIHFDREVELLEDFTGSRTKLDRELDEMTPSDTGAQRPPRP